MTLFQRVILAVAHPVFAVMVGYMLLLGVLLISYSGRHIIA